ncbi:MAG: hypothetical protein IKK81_07365 [Prevotella sp.]|nr:hypothetical protein [Prevotella sp.]
MRRIGDNDVNESVDNAVAAFENYAKHKHSRDYVQKFEENLLTNLAEIVGQIANESWTPKGYTDKVIFERKLRRLAKAPIEDHVLEAATIFPYEKALYDFSTWRAPAVKPNMGTHALFRILRNDLFNNDQETMMYYIAMDVHHYFPSMSHAVLKGKLARKVKKGKLLNFLHKVVDSYPIGVPLGIKVAQIFGQIYLADFDRLAMRFFDIGKDPEKLRYWTQRYVTARILTAKSKSDYDDLCKGPAFLAWKFRSYVNEGVRFYYRFVDNIIAIHEDKAVLHIIKELMIMHITRDYLATINSDYNVRPTWMGIRIVGYVFYHDHVMVSQRHRKELARRVRRLQKLGYDEEQIRIKQASRIGFVKHANSTQLFKTLGMENSLGRIIRERRVKAPFDDMTSAQKVRFSSIVNLCGAEGEKTKILLIDYKITESKIEKENVRVQVEDSDGIKQFINKPKASMALAIRFKVIIHTHVKDGQEFYEYAKQKDTQGQPTLLDAEFYSFTGSKILIDQAQNDFTKDDLPCPTIIQQFRAKNGQTFVKFT